MAVVMNWPLALVEPEVAPKITLPVPVCVRVTTAPAATVALAASFAVTVRLTVVVLSRGSDDALDVRVTVEPTICTGICDVTEPAVAVIVAVRLALFPPQERVTVPGVVTVGALRKPVSVLNVTTTPDNVAFAEFNALTVIVEVVEPSVFMDVGDAARSRDAAEGVVVDPPPVSAVSALPPQAIRQQNRNKEKSRHNCRNNFALITLIIITLLFKSGIDFYIFMISIRNVISFQCFFTRSTVVFVII
jgi:hypothetical protein